jgi:hypothetical protein
MPSRSNRNNNPGNLRFSPFTQRRGAVDDGANYSKFPTMIQGLAAMLDLIATNGYRNMTIKDAITLKYAPSADGNRPEQYVSFVCQNAGLKPDMKITDLNPFQVLGLVAAMVVFEGWK